MTQPADIPSHWPWRAFSRRLDVRGTHWHIQQHGSGPDLLLVHGTGGSTHSWAPSLDALATRFRVLAVDLPGHGFTSGGALGGDRYALPTMARALGDLLDHLGVRPALAAGHSAGVPILLQLACEQRIAPIRIVGFNAALVPPPQLYLSLIAPLLGAIVERDIVAQGGAWLAGATTIVELMLSSSGTTLDADALARYRWLCTKPEHVHAALTMMSRWDLPRLLRDAVTLRTRVRIIAGRRDRWVPPDALSRVVDRLPSAEFVVEEAGHLLPEERADIVLRELTL